MTQITLYLDNETFGYLGWTLFFALGAFFGLRADYRTYTKHPPMSSPWLFAGAFCFVVGIMCLTATIDSLFTGEAALGE